MTDAEDNGAAESRPQDMADRVVSSGPAEHDAAAAAAADAPPPTDASPSDGDAPADADYSGRVQKRIARERRLRGEAERRAQALANQVAVLRGHAANSQATALAYADRATNTRLAIAQGEARAAHASGNADRIVRANQELTQAMVEAGQMAEVKRRLAAVRQIPRPAPEPAGGGTIEPGTQAWIGRNPWFVSDPDMREAALRVHNKITDSHPPGSPQYFQEMDRRMRAAFPDEFDGDGEAGGDPAGAAASPVAPTPQARSRPGGEPPGRRSSVRLTGEQVELSRLMGITPEAYARRQLQLIREGKIRA